LKRILFLILTAVFLSSAFSLGVKAEDIPWCEPSVAHFDYEERMELGIFTTTFDENCRCYQEDYLYEGEWRDLYCLPEGKLKQARTVKIRIKPWCKDWEWKTEEREIDAEFCKKCPDPNVLSAWELVGCENNTKIYKRKIEAYFFNPAVSDCFKQNYVEFKFEKTNSCEGIKDQPYIWYKIKRDEEGEAIMPEPQPEGLPIPSTHIAVVIGVLLLGVFILFKGGKAWAFLKRKKA